MKMNRLSVRRKKPCNVFLRTSMDVLVLGNFVLKRI